MAEPFPSSDSGMTLAEGLKMARDQSTVIRDIAAGYSAKMKAGPVQASSIFSLLANLADAKRIFASAAALPGMDAYAEAQLGSSIAASFTAMTSAVNAAGNWIFQNFPKATDGNLKFMTMNTDWSLTEGSFTTAQLAGLTTLLDALAVTITSAS